MKSWLVDTNVLLDVLGADPEYGKYSSDVLGDLAEHGILIINPIIYAEVGIMIETKEELDALLPFNLFLREPIPWEAAFVAGKAFRKYKKQRGKKPRMLADIIIGAHAAVGGHGLVSRDTGYLSYFKIELVDPVSYRRSSV